ncbi:hypothetical protein IFM89_001400 [Coptis chinensis]|uniref:RING-type E3 ubiquitin transferase n=1 Tax=Coptis chinensis TaxID=261450 RepID=A0A835HNC1_9MAGN|nr:hypothetical protein IFM89_001400 [Coptis chinensis]
MSTNGGNESRQYYPQEKYALSGKIMLSAIVILFTVVLLIICLHIYARWYLARTRRRQVLNRRRNRAHIIFTTPSTTTTISQGLDASLLKYLPTFIYTSNSHEHDALECAVCLSEFEENEKGRLLPKCNHSFHIGCIDMWFHSHSTCPLCRSPVTIPEPENTRQTPLEIVVHSPNTQQPETPSSILCSSCAQEGTSSSSTSVGSRRQAFELAGVVSIEVPRRNESFKNLEEGSPLGSQVFKSPGGRIRSFKRILSRDRKQPSTPMSCCSSAAAIEIDLERGENEEQAQQASSPTPLNHHQTSTV